MRRSIVLRCLASLTAVFLLILAHSAANGEERNVATTSVSGGPPGSLDESSSFMREDKILTYKETNKVLVRELVDWIRSKGGTFDDRQEVYTQGPGKRISLYATKFIPEGTVLCSIPRLLSLSPPAVADEDSGFCETARLVRRELLLDEESPFWPLLRLLTRTVVPPARWSQAGQELLRTVLGTNVPPRNTNQTVHLWKDKCGGDSENDRIGLEAALLVAGFRSRTFSPHTSERQYGMIPFLDLYGHRDWEWKNAAVYEKGDVYIVIAEEDIGRGEPIYGSLGDGSPTDTTNLFRDCGFVEDLPQLFSFVFADDGGENVVSFDYYEDFDEIDNEAGHYRKKAEWSTGWPPSSKAYSLLTRELDRLESVSGLVHQDSLHLLSVPEDELLAISNYYSALVEATRSVVENNSDRWTITPDTLVEYEVSGVNLGEYKLFGGGDARGDACYDVEPFELFEDFDIGHLIQGNETWHDILDYRRHILKRPSLSFYVDKVARKRWLQSMGFLQPQLYVLNYAHELTDSGTVEDETRVLLEVLPDSTDYAAKPTHHSTASGVLLVSHDTASGATSWGRRELIEDSNFDKYNVARSLADNLHTDAPPFESWALKNVKPGVVVEERFVQVGDFGKPPVEFKLFTIWGRVWIVQINDFEGKDRYWDFFYRNGTNTNGDDGYISIPDYVDFPRLIEIAEQLGANKDMFRTDVFVGLSANSHSEGTLAEVKMAVSECEISPGTVFHSEDMTREAARLWIAGYKIGNYRTVKNTEVPAEFLETGFLSAPPE